MLAVWCGFVLVTLQSHGLFTVLGFDYGVLWTPMHHFYEAGSAVRALRLSCSVVTPEQIEVGLDRLAELLNDEIARRVT